VEQEKDLNLMIVIVFQVTYQMTKMNKEVKMIL